MNPDQAFAPSLSPSRAAAAMHGPSFQSVRANFHYFNDERLLPVGESFATDAMTAHRTFLSENGQGLRAAGHALFDLRFVAELPEEQGRFVVDHAQLLYQAGHAPIEMRVLAALPEAQRKFVVEHAPLLHKAGHDAYLMRRVAGMPEVQRKFVVEHARMLYASGHDAAEMRCLAALPEAERRARIASALERVGLAEQAD